MSGRATISVGGKPIKVRESARELDLDPATLSKILNGTRDPEKLRAGTAIRLASYFEFRTVQHFIDAVKARRDGWDGVPTAAQSRSVC